LRAWAHARGVDTTQSQTNSLRYNNCEICHGPRTTVPAAPSSGWVDSFVPDAAAFKAVPTSHASCFNCHWKSEQPTSENCGGCHKRLSTLSTNVSLLVSVNPKPAEAVPSFLPELRLSMKFRHAREQHVAECTTCHINITKSSTLRGLKPDVPITACTECHNKDGLRQDVSKELEAIDKNRDFTCSYCHTSDIGRGDPPASHYLIAGREAMKRKDIK
ncbi:MAG TPA: cytochrome c3 family protein, partial [Pyrinomonadaceae bacterium]|nr:cytochrome c3 family protein [Pyrinomonadaceae bacterium]